MKEGEARAFYALDNAGVEGVAGAVPGFLLLREEHELAGLWRALDSALGGGQRAHEENGVGLGQRARPGVRAGQHGSEKGVVVGEAGAELRAGGAEKRRLGRAVVSATGGRDGESQGKEQPPHGTIVDRAAARASFCHPPRKPAR